jgi:hypothetical protein
VSAELVPAGHDATLPSLAVAQSRVAELVADREAGVLDDVRAQSEAHRFYEQRAKNHERADHFNRLTILAEAALGLLALDNSAVKAKSDWRTLAFAYERDPNLVMACYDEVLERGDRLPSAGTVAYVIRRRGLSSVPRADIVRIVDEFRSERGLSKGEFCELCRPEPVQLSVESFPWRKARRIAAVVGHDVATLPPDPSYWEREEERKSMAARESRERNSKLAKLAAEEERELNRRATRRAGKALERAHSLIVRAAQELDRAKDEADNGVGWGRPWDLEQALYRLYDVEDRLGRAAREGPPPDRPVPLLPVAAQDADPEDAALIADGFRGQEVAP